MVGRSVRFGFEVLQSAAQETRGGRGLAAILARGQGLDLEGVAQPVKVILDAGNVVLEPVVALNVHSGLARPLVERLQELAVPHVRQNVLLSATFAYYAN